MEGEGEKDEIFNIKGDELSTPSMQHISKTIDPKKVIIIAACVAIALITLIIIIAIAVSGSKESPEEEASNDEARKIGQIDCIYDIEYTSRKETLLSESFNSQDIAIYIDGKRIKFSKEYQFSIVGIHRVKILIFSPLNMDYMFKDVSQVRSVEMYSNNTAKITSMIGAFENAINLVNYRIDGFDTSSVTSMHKLFKGTNFDKIDTNRINSGNVEDMSYMFADMKNLVY